MTVVVECRAWGTSQLDSCLRVTPRPGPRTGEVLPAAGRRACTRIRAYRRVCTRAVQACACVMVQRSLVFFIEM